MAADPCGHQLNNTLNIHLDDILEYKLPAAIVDDALRAWSYYTAISEEYRQVAREILDAVQGQRRGRKLAIFAMQPPDWLTYEGAYDEISVDALIARWAISLPDGWVGIPTFHPTSRFPVALGQSIVSAFPNVAFLPEHLSSGTTELLLPAADALVTISSTSAMSACLAGVPAVVVGQCAFSNLLGRDVKDIALVEPRSLPERAGLIAFHTHRFAHSGSRFCGEEQYFSNLVRNLSQAPRPADILLDMRPWEPSAIADFF